VKEQEWVDWTWPIIPAEAARPMYNCLRPVGIPCSAYQAGPDVCDGVSVPDSHQDAIPSIPGSFIHTPNGTRHLLHDELTKGLGVPKTWMEDNYPDRSGLMTTVALHLMESITPLFVHEGEE
jgi:hypothetical protein